MSEITTIGLDLAKNVFQVPATIETDKPAAPTADFVILADFLSMSVQN